MKGSVNSVLNFLILIFAGCAALSMLSEDPGGNPAKKDVNKKTFEAVM
jgi:hypothetical protein